jgi:hypothetical protein
MISDTRQGNLQAEGFEVPSIANCDKVAAPSQYHNRRTFVSVTSLPFLDSNVPANAPAE